MRNVLQSEPELTFFILFSPSVMGLFDARAQLWQSSVRVKRRTYIYATGGIEAK